MGRMREEVVKGVGQCDLTEHNYSSWKKQTYHAKAIVHKGNCSMTHLILLASNCALLHSIYNDKCKQCWALGPGRHL